MLCLVFENSRENVREKNKMKKWKKRKNEEKYKIDLKLINHFYILL